MNTSLLKLARSAAASLGFIAALSVLGSGAQAATNPAFQVQASGQGQPMILIPGLSSPGEVWKDTVAHYDRHYRCYVLTLAGFAGTPATDGPLLQQAEQQLMQLIASEKMDKPIIVGHSMGGFLAMQTAADHPDKIGKLIIVDTMPALGATQMPSMTEAQLKEMAAPMRDKILESSPAALEAKFRGTASTMISKPEDIERIVGWSMKSDQKTIANSMYEMLSTDLRDKIGQIKSPTLVLGTWIAYKQYMPRSTAESTFKLQYAKLPGVKIELSDTSRHFIMYDDPQWMLARMDEFLK
ncbi:alpha/beta fold hydrolase [Undibacterium terreum]|uniref:Alpha/beta hydrolase n=1 Tax=Undibacterium terreum TaxID=1224302 RepID=A0A916UZM0_9BURK|nr:alpha/beta hydrolase [Undibacterium terreum]GGC95934.1 alpha/beta hydrolase [Undibacterium terreum]